MLTELLRDDMGLRQAAKLIWLLLLCKCIIWLALLGLAATSSEADENVREACSVTRYVDVCIHSLAPYSTRTPKSNYTAWARAGVSVALLELKNTKGCLEKMNKSRKWRGGGTADCVECFGDAVDNLHQSLCVLRELDKVTFDEQMADVITWMSAALTYEDTCMDGLEEGGSEKGRRRRKKKKKVMDRVRNCTYVTSNALALLNKLASTGF